MPARASPPHRPIAALDGPTTGAAQTIMQVFAASLASSGWRVAGVLECHDRSWDGVPWELRDLRSGQRFTTSQTLGAGSTACRLDPGGLAQACASVQGAIQDGADIVILSKFGKAEAEGRGLLDALKDAIGADIPTVICVPSQHRQFWTDFAGNYAQSVGTTLDDLMAWWSQSVRGSHTQQ